VILASNSDLDDYQNGGVLDDVTMSDRQETLSDVALYSGGSVDEEQLSATGEMLHTSTRDTEHDL
jgi:hypothetical protein